MSVSYAPAKLRVPPGFEYALEGLTREILREQPQDIIVFAAEYFKKKLTLRDEGGVEDTNVPTPVLEPIDIDLKDPEVGKAASLIQSSFRDHLARKASKEPAASKGDVEEPAPEQQEIDIDLSDPEVGKAASLIQSSFRDHLARKASKEPAASKGDGEEPEEIDIDLSDPEVGKAASVIQSSFRAHMAKKNPKPDATKPTEETEKVTSEEEIDIDLNDPEVHKAASAIQSSFRAHMARKSSKEPIESKSGDTETAGEVELASGGGESELEPAGVTSEVEVKEDGPVEEGSSAESQRAAEGKAEGDEVVKEDPSPPTDEGKADSGEGGPSGD